MNSECARPLSRRKPSGRLEKVLPDRIEFDAAILCGQLAVPESSRSGVAVGKVIFHSAHAGNFSPVDLAIGQDRRKQGPGTFKFTIGLYSLFDQ